MVDYSFLVFCDSTRRDNLLQVFRFLDRREGGIMGRAEVVVVCQDRIEAGDLPGTGSRVVNLGLPEFNKPVMVNHAVREAAGDRIVILDGDRILPVGFFARWLAAVMPGQIVCPERLYKLDRPYTDEQIEVGAVNKSEDFRVPAVAPGRKNAFSGMAVMCKSDYWLAGGMDESLVNYGCSDTDFTMTCLRAGLKIVYTDDEELHLWHTVNMTYENFFLVNLKSVCRYCRKWRAAVPETFAGKVRPNILM